MKQKILLLNDTTSWYHFGCAATSTALKSSIASFGYELVSIPIMEIYKLDNIPNTVKGFLDQDNVKMFFMQNPIFARSIMECDGVIINGEGTLHGIRPASLALLYLAFISKKFLNKHVEIINHSVYPQDDLSLDNVSKTDIYRLVYNEMDFVAIREPVSFKLMSKLGLKVCESSDCMPIYIRDHYASHGHKDPFSLLLAGSATWLHLNVASKDRGNIEDFERGIDGLVKYLYSMQERGYKVQFLYSDIDYPAKDDLELIEYLKPKISLEILSVKSTNEWLSVIENARLLVSGRFHHTLAAACLKTDFIALNSNTPKIDGLMKSLDGSYVLSYTDSKIFEKLMERTKLIEHGLAKKFCLEALCKKAANNFEGLRQLQVNT